MDRDDLKVIAFAHPWKKPGYQLVKSEQLQGKGQVAEVTQYRHFENPPKIDEGNLVDPFGIGNPFWEDPFLGGRPRPGDPSEGGRLAELV